jgi:YesN/AraC family two-component response regulator
VGEVAESVGYTDEKAFYKVFKAATGMSPMGYRKKFGGGAALSYSE